MHTYNLHMHVLRSLFLSFRLSRWFVAVVYACCVKWHGYSKCANARAIRFRSSQHSKTVSTFEFCTRRKWPKDKTIKFLNLFNWIHLLPSFSFSPSSTLFVSASFIRFVAILEKVQSIFSCSAQHCLMNKFDFPSKQNKKSRTATEINNFYEFQILHSRRTSFHRDFQRI